MARATPRAVKAREDLKYHERTVGDEEIVFIHDPVRGTYIKFNPLQAAMLRALDGKRTPADVADVLSEQFDVEIPQEAASRFVERARDMMLLEIASYDVTPDAARAQIRKALQKAGFRMRSTGRDPSRSLSQESMLFAEAFRQLELGLPLRAARCLAKVRERNPRNVRAKQLYELIQGAYIKASGTLSNDLPTRPLVNPNRLLRWVDQRFGRFLFAWPGMLAIAVCLYLGAHAYMLISWDSVTASVFNIVVAFSVILTSGVIHELSHGLTCQHYGGDVTEVGVMMFYGMPAPYCDVSSSYLINDRRHKMLIQLAGTVGSVLCIATESILLAALDPGMPIYPGIAIALVVQIAQTGWDFIPLVKTDAYYALCDYYQFPNLKERANKLTKAWLSKRVLGIDMAAEELPPHTRRLLMLFATASYFFTVWSIFLLSHFLAPIVDHFGGPGLVVVFLFIAYMLRGFTFLPLANLLRLIIRERRRIFTRRRSAAFLVAVFVLVAPWFLTRPVLIDADCVVLPQQRADIRAQTSGRVDRIMVKEGDHVRRGQPIASLSNSTLEVNIARTEAELAVATDHLAELQNGPRPEELALAHSRVDRANGEAARSASEAAIAIKLAAANLGPRSRVDTAQENLAVTAGSASVERLSLSLVQAGAREEEVAVAKAEQARISSHLAQLQSDKALLVLRSPIDGIIATPHLEQKLQAFLAPGDQFAEVHDLSAGIAEITLAPTDPLSEIAANDEIELRLYNDPRVSTHARVDRLRDVAGSDDQAPRVVVVTSPFHLERALSGVSGHARIYAAERSLAYAYLYLPFQRLFRVRLWSLRW